MAVEGAEMRELSSTLPLVDFAALKPGDRIHYNSGYVASSWTAEVRSSPIDGEVVVVRKSRVDGGARRNRGSSSYDVLDRIFCEVASEQGKDRAALRMGPAPYALRRGVEK